MLSQLLYRSRQSTTVDWTWSILSKIIQVAQDRNRADQISGLLLWLDGSFLQVLEGPRAAVSNCFLRIAHDPRHQAIEILSMRPIGERLFPDWRMRAVDHMRLENKQQEFLASKYGASQATPPIAPPPSLSIPDNADLALSLLLDVLTMARTSSPPSK